jgi:hypothetical protein
MDGPLNLVYTGPQHVDATDMPDMLEGWREMITALESAAQELAWNADTPRLAFGLDRVRELRKALSDLERSIEQIIVDLMDSKTETVDGLGTLERKRGTDRKAWQSEELLIRLVRDAVDPEGTGELPDPVEVLTSVVQMVTECMPVTPSMGWRVTALRARGIDPDEWAETKPGRTSVQIHKAD